VSYNILPNGTRVQFIQGHLDETARYNGEHLDQEGNYLTGTILKYTGVDDYVHVKWDNGNASRNYKCEALRIVDEEVKIGQMNIHDFEVGMRVMMNPEHECYEQYKSQHKGDPGVIVDISDILSFPIKVKWDNGNINNYHQGMLICINEISTEKETDERYKFPLLPGQRVCVNPESSTYKDLKRENISTEGWIVNTNTNLFLWNKLSKSIHRTLEIIVKLDNYPAPFTFTNQSLLPIDVPMKTVQVFKLMKSGISIAKYILEGDDTLENNLDETIIKKGYEIKSTTTWNNKTRAHLITTLANETNQ